MINIDDRILSEVDENQLFLLCAIAKHMGENTKAWPSNRTLCETTRWSPNKLQRVKKSAIEAGILGAESRFQKAAQTSNLYEIKTRRIGVMVNLADITPHPQNRVSPHPKNDTPALPQNGVYPHPQNGVTEVLTNEVLTNEQGDRNTPAPESQNLKAEKNESGLVAPGEPLKLSKEQFEYLQSEAQKNESPKVALKGSLKSCPISCSPSDYCAGGKCDLNGCFIPTVRNYEPSEFDIYGIQPLEILEGDEDLAFDLPIKVPDFVVTAIASPTEIPGVTLVEAAPFADENGKTWHDGTQMVQAAIHHRKNGRIEIPDEAAAEIMPWANGDGAQTVKGWYSRAYRAWSPSDVENMVFKFSTVFLSSEKAATRNMMETDPLAFFKKRFSGFIVDQPAFDRMNAQPGNQAQVRNGTHQPQSTLPKFLQNQIGK